MSTILAKKDCEIAVRNFLESSNFVLKDYEFKSLGDKIVGFMGKHLKMTASVVFDGKVRELKFFAKLAPTNEGHRALVLENSIFSKEIDAYKILVPELDACLPSDVKLPVPKCLFIRDAREKDRISVQGSSEEEIIILEDVNDLGYFIQENFPPLDIPHCQVALKALAKFHAPSILLENSYKKSHPHEDPADGIFSCAKEKFLVLDKESVGYKWCESCSSSMSTAVVKIWPQRFQGKREKILKTLLEMWERVIVLSQPSRKYTNVLCHGDLWTNNVLFKYDKERESGKITPQDALFVDLQVVRYAPPILDILLYLHVCSRRDFREKNLTGLLKHYHDSLKEFAPPDLIDRVLPFSSLLESCDEMRDFGRLMSCFYVTIIMGENDPCLGSNIEGASEQLDVVEALFSDNGEKIWNNCNRSETYRERTEETYRECLEELSLWKNE